MTSQYPNEKHQVGAVLNQLMQEKNIDESSLSKECKISLASLSRIKNNPDSNPTISTLRPIAEFFQISIDQLLGYSPISKSANSIQRIALIQEDDVLNWLQNKTTKNPINQWLVYDFNASDTSFALKYKLNYHPNIRQDSTLIIDPRRELQHNDLLLIYNKKLQQYFVRKIAIDDQEKVFISPLEEGFSEYISLDSCSNNIQAIGVVVETRLQYQR